MVRINRKQLDFEIASQAKTVKQVAEKYARDVMFNPAVSQLMQEFDEDPVTLEIDDGPDSFPYSSAVSAGNLFSFIGFSQGSRPTDQIRSALNPRSPFGPKLRYLKTNVRGFSYEFRVTAPDLDAIYARTPIPWAEGLSWAERIEKGISGLGSFLNKKGLRNSRSGGGIQVKKNLRSAKFRPQPYLRSIFNNFLSKFGNTKI